LIALYVVAGFCLTVIVVSLAVACVESVGDAVRAWSRPTAATPTTSSRVSIVG